MGLLFLFWQILRLMSGVRGVGDGVAWTGQAQALGFHMQEDLAYQNGVEIFLGNAGIMSLGRHVSGSCKLTKDTSSRRLM